uniref:Mannosyltransferase n=1 Tax=Schistocephalus solidus TaxID=70667 RepID=A0A183T232_SCHSO
LLLPLLILFRIFNALIIRTTFVPDEYWQYGALTWEWWNSTAIRSPLHPLMFAGLYKLLAAVGFDSRLAIIYLPRLLHGILAAVADYNLYGLTNLISDPTTAKWTLIAQCTNWFTAFCGPRSLANNLEWALTTAAFNFYPWSSFIPLKKRSTCCFILLVCVCSILRPTAAVIWAPICVFHLLCEFSASTSRLFRTFGLYVAIAIPCLLISIISDRIAFGRWTLHQLNFLRFNILANGANFYGIEPWHWYFTNGLPTMLFTSAPFCVVGFIIDFTALVYGVILCSSLAHKEYRFIFPILPLLHYFTGRGLVCASNALHRSGRKTVFCVFSPKTALAVFLVISHMPLALYTCLVHQRGPTELMELLGSQGDRNNWPSATPLSIMNGKTSESDEQMRALFLMPCHTTPYLSYLHRNISLRLLACDPNLSALTGEDPAGYVDEADIFYADPSAWLEANYSDSLKLPHLIAIFDHLLMEKRYSSSVTDFLKTHDFFLCARLFHAHFPTHRRHGKYIYLFCHRGSPFELK